MCGVEVYFSLFFALKKNQKENLVVEKIPLLRGGGCVCVGGVGGGSVMFFCIEKGIFSSNCFLIAIPLTNFSF